MGYDFTTLSPDDFEALVADLFSRFWGTRLEAFKAGKDGGIDLRNSRVPAGRPQTIVQCKRYAPHKFLELQRSMVKEKVKLDRLRPEHYVLATSANLSDENKSALLKILTPWCRSPGDIYGPIELNGMLRDYPEVERSHFKLWIASTAVLERVLHARIFNLTEATLETTKHQLSKLVVHDGFNRALGMLKEQHHVLILGIPGIGKTTLTRMLMCHYMHEGFEPVSVGSNIEDVWTVVQDASARNRPMVVLYDDFLGRFEFKSQRFGKNEEHELLAFFDKVRRSPSLRFILTTREYILADAQRLHGAFDARAGEILKCTLSLGDYAKAHRARMLFNHLYFSDLPDSRLEKLIEHRTYRKIIEHEHFNPRTVESISKHANSRSLTDDAYLHFVEQEFGDPSNIWEHAFLRDIGPASRQLLALLWSFGGEVELEMLRSALLKLRANEPAEEVSMQFRDSLKELDGNFIHSDRYAHRDAEATSAFVIHFQNPSVEEFLQKFLKSEPMWLMRLIHGVVCLRQVEAIADLARVASPSLPKQFWMDLRYVAAAVELIPAGHVINFKAYGSAGPKKTWTSDKSSFPERTLTLLRIEADAGCSDSHARDMWARVSTKDGWDNLIAGAESDDSIAYRISRLQEWIHEHDGWTDESKALVDMGLRAALFEFLIDEDRAWPISLSALRSLIETATTYGPPLSLVERTCYLEATKAAVRTLVDNAEDAQDVESEIVELGRIAAICGENADVLHAESETMRRRAQQLEEREDQWPEPVPDDRRYDARSGDALNVDELFRGLLDR